LFKISKYREAIESLNNAIALKSNDEEIFFYKGLCLNLIGNYKEAVDSYNRAIEINPNFFLAYNNKGNYLYYVI
jgi:tetratricopeptide (TPR) repeat protein